MMQKSAFLLLLSNLGFISSVNAIEFIGSLGYQARSYQDIEQIENDYFVTFETSYHTGDLSIESAVSARSFAEAEYDLYNDQLYINHLSLKYAFNNFDIKLGRIDLRYGRATFVNPTDYFDPRDYRDVLQSQDRRLPTDLINIKTYTNLVDVSVVIAPGQTKSLMPHTNSKWFFDLPEEVLTDQGQLISIAYQWEDYNQSFTEYSDPQYMLRVDKSLASMSYSLSYYHGEDNVPLFQEGAPVFDNNELTIELAQIYPQKEAFGFDLEWLLESMVVRVEAANIVMKTSDGLKDEYQHLVIGFDTNLSNGLFSKDTFIAVEFSKQFSDNIDDYEREDIRHLFKETLFIKTDIEIDNYNTLSLEAIYDIENYQRVALFSWQHQFNDYLLTKIYGDFMSGSPETFFGQYNNNRVGLNMEYKF